MGFLVTLTFANILTAVGIVFLSLSFATDHWIDITVRRDDLNATLGNHEKLKTEKLYFSRNRGLFRTCYDGDTVFLDNRDDVIGGHCLAEKGYEISRRESTTNWSDEYDTRIHLIRCHFAVMLISIIMILIAFIFGATSCYKPKLKWFRAAGILNFFAAFFVGTGMALFHGYEYLEKEKITTPNKDEFYKDYSVQIVKGTSLLKEYMKWTYGYSYVLGWIGMAVAAISAILFLVTAFTMANKTRKEKRPLPDHDYHTDYGYNQNLAPTMAPTMSPTMAAGGYPMSTAGLSNYPTMNYGYPY